MLLNITIEVHRFKNLKVNVTLNCGTLHDKLAKMAITFKITHLTPTRYKRSSYQGTGGQLTVPMMVYYLLVLCRTMCCNKVSAIDLHGCKDNQRKNGKQENLYFMVVSSTKADIQLWSRLPFFLQQGEFV